jgi:hypothetical protein
MFPDDICTTETTDPGIKPRFPKCFFTVSLPETDKTRARDPTFNNANGIAVLYFLFAKFTTAKTLSLGKLNGAYYTKLAASKSIPYFKKVR